MIKDDNVWTGRLREAPAVPIPATECSTQVSFEMIKHDQSGDDQQHYRGDDDYES